MTIETKNPITVEAKNGSVYTISPVGNATMRVEIGNIEDQNKQQIDGINRQRTIEDWGNPDWVPEDDMEDEEVPNGWDRHVRGETQKAKPPTDDMCSWPLP